MHDRDLYAQILGVTSPWGVMDVQLNQKDRMVEVHLAHQTERGECAECGVKCPKYDARERRWRHLDTCQFQTILVAQVPRVECGEHGVHQVKVPWAEKGSRFTALFEALTIDWLKQTSISGVSELLGLSWAEVDGIMGRAVARGLARRKEYLPTQLGVDETSFQKRHEYVTVVSDQAEGTVLYVADGRGKDELKAFYQRFPAEELQGLDTVAMDMHEPFISATREVVPQADEKIAFDKFHVAKHLGDAVDKVRREEHRALLGLGDERLSKTKYLWLKNPANLSADQKQDFAALRISTLKTARAWALKEAAMGLWHYRSRSYAQKVWLRWYAWGIRSRLVPVKKVARMVKHHLEGILNAVVSGITNARAEGINAVIQWVKYTARGFRNRDRFRNAIYFHLGGLDLYPASVRR
jgi:transposase